MADDENGAHELSLLMQQLAEALGAGGGELALSEASFARFRAKLVEAPVEEQDDLLAELISLAILLQRQEGGGAERAVEQLAELAAAVIGEEAAAALIGVDPAAAERARLTGGAQDSKVPVGAGEKPSGAFNPMALRLGQGAPKKKR